jgi:hypothetical protein
MDGQGWELEVLRGADALLARTPSLISRLHRKTRLGESPWRRAT